MRRPELLLLHGWGCNSGVFAPLAAHLDEGFEVIRPDLPGCGARSGDVPGDFAAVLAGLRDAVPRGALCVAWSLGALFALALAAADDNPVAGLLLVGATPCFAARRDWPHGAPASKFARMRAALDTDPAATLRRFHLECLAPQGGRERLRRLEADIDAAGGFDRTFLDCGLDWLAATDLRPRLADVTIPVEVVHGDGDRVVAVAAGRELARRLPDARLRVLPGSGHTPFYTRPEAFAREVVAWASR